MSADTKHWFNGQPVPGVDQADMGATKYWFNGQPVPLVTESGGITYTLVADHGVYNLTGQDAGLFFNRTLIADRGTFTLTGQDITFSRNYVLNAETGYFTLIGGNVTFGDEDEGGQLFVEIRSFTARRRI